MGPVGAGQLTKMVNQICIAGVVEGLSEGLSFARAAGLDPAAVVEVISKGAAQSWQMENRTKTMLAGQFNHGFAVEWMRKDLAICFDEAGAQRRGAACHTIGRSFLRRSGSDGRQTLGYLQPVCAARSSKGKSDGRTALLSSRRSAQCIARCRARHFGGRVAGGAEFARRRAPRRREPCRALSPFSQSRSLAGGTCHRRVCRAAAEIVAAAAAPGAESDRITNIGAAYMRFVARRPALTRLMFGPQLPNRDAFPALGEAADAIGTEIGNALHDSALGLAVWASVHGLAMLILEERHRSWPAALAVWTCCRRARRFCCAVCSR